MKLNAKSIPHFVQCSVLFCTSAQDKIRNCNKGFQSLMHCQTCLVLYVLQWRNGYPKLDFSVSTRNNLSKNGLKVGFQSSVMLHFAHSTLKSHEIGQIINQEKSCLTHFFTELWVFPKPGFQLSVTPLLDSFCLIFIFYQGPRSAKLLKTKQ